MAAVQVGQVVHLVAACSGHRGAKKGGGSRNRVPVLPTKLRGHISLEEEAPFHLAPPGGVMPFSSCTLCTLS